MYVSAINWYPWPPAKKPLNELNKIFCIFDCFLRYVFSLLKLSWEMLKI